MTDGEMKIIQILTEQIKLTKETNQKLDLLIKSNVDILNFWAILKDQESGTNSLDQTYLKEISKDFQPKEG